VKKYHLPIRRESSGMDSTQKRAAPISSAHKKSRSGLRSTMNGLNGNTVAHSSVPSLGQSLNIRLEHLVLETLRLEHGLGDVVERHHALQ
jgi:hypothetical protein